MVREVYSASSFDIVIPSPKRVVSVKLEVDLIEEIDRLWRSLGYSSRSEFIREAIIYYMQIVTLRNREKEKMDNEKMGEEDIVDERGVESLRRGNSYLVVDTATDIA